jgi:U3 small nucleolar RNA-associated protein 14
MLARAIKYERNLWQVRESMVRKKLRAKAIYKILTKTYPNVRCELDYKNPYQLLVATVLSNHPSLI